MQHSLVWSEEASAIMDDLERDPTYARKCRKIKKAAAQLQVNPRHPGLHTHPYSSLRGPGGEVVYEAYVENRTPSAWRIWYWYGPDRGVITILTVGPHPD